MSASQKTAHIRHIVANSSRLRLIGSNWVRLWQIEAFSRRLGHKSIISTEGARFRVRMAPYPLQGAPKNLACCGALKKISYSDPKAYRI